MLRDIHNGVLPMKFASIPPCLDSLTCCCCDKKIMETNFAAGKQGADDVHYWIKRQPYNFGIGKRPDVDN